MSIWFRNPNTQSLEERHGLAPITLPLFSGGDPHPFKAMTPVYKISKQCDAN